MIESWLPILFVLYYILAIGIGLTIILENRNPPKTLAYLLVIVLLPFAGMVVYYFFGQDFRKQKIFSRKALRDNRVIKKWIGERSKEFEGLEQMAKGQFGDLFKIARMLWNHQFAALTINNKVNILQNGETFFPALMRDIAAAKKNIHLEFYIYEEGKTLNELVSLLVKKAAEGINVRFIYDSVGSQGLHNKTIKKLKKGGVEVFGFMPVLFPEFAGKANYRNHRKLCVIDGKIGYSGGINLSDRYRNDLEYNTIYWRDTHLRIQGAAVFSMQLHFLLSWNFVSKRFLPIERTLFAETDVQDQVLTQIVGSGPDSDFENIMHAFFMAINSAKKSVWIATPYFIPNEQILTALVTASLSGIDVKLMIPAEADSRIVQAASMSFVKELLEVGVEVYLYEKGFLHCKTMVVDEHFGSVGTANMDYRSFAINFEMSTLLYDTKLVTELRQQFEEDLKHTKKMSLTRWDKRPLTKRFLESTARLIAPLL